MEHPLEMAHNTPYDAFSNTTQPTSSHANQSAQINPYVPESNGYGRSTYFQGQSNYTQPVSFFYCLMPYMLIYCEATTSSLRCLGTSSRKLAAKSKSSTGLLHTGGFEAAAAKEDGGNTEVVFRYEYHAASLT